MTFKSIVFVLALLSLSATAHAQAFANFDAKIPIIALTAAGAGTTNSLDQQNTYGKGAVVGIDITAVSGTVAVVVNIQGKDFATGQYYTIASTASLTGTGFTTLTVYPGVAATANVAVSAVLPATWRAQVVSGTGSTPAVTLEIGASTIE
jgi:hypothetical protein